jgi:hypothetical protein
MPARRIAGFLLVLTVAFAAPAGNAAAAGNTPQTQTVTNGTTTAGTTTATTPSTGNATGTTTTPNTNNNNRASGESNGRAERGLAVGILVLGVVGLALAYFFYNGWRNSYQKLAESALRITRRVPQTIFNPVENAQFRPRGITAAAAAEQPVVRGPAAIAVGEPTTYKATVGGAPGASCAWAVEPTDSAAVKPETGAETTLTALKEGPITLTAKVGTAEPTLVHVTAIARVAEGGVPLLGTGFGGVAAAMIAFAIAGALTALNILSGAAFIAFLGPVVGYFFAAARDSGHAGGTQGGSGGAAT